MQTTLKFTTVNEEDATEAFTTNVYIISSEPTYPKLPKPLRLSSSILDKDYTDDVNNIDNIIEEQAKEIARQERHHNKHHDRISDKEVVEELDESSLSKSLNKVKKMYRDSAASVVNKLSGKGGKSGIFLTDNCTTVIAQIGTTAILHCEVSDITENTVSGKHSKL